jgi:hypothetical protein
LVEGAAAPFWGAVLPNGDVAPLGVFVVPVAAGA